MFLHVVYWCDHVGVGLHGCVVHKERFVFVVPDELQCFVLNQLRRVHPVLLPSVFNQQLPLTVVPNEGGIIAMGNPLAVVSVEAIEAHLQRFAGGRWSTKTPLPKDRSFIAGFFHHVSHRKSIGRHRFLTFRFDFCVSADNGVSRVKSGQQAAA